MDLIGVLVIVGILIAAGGLGFWAKLHPSQDKTEREWQDAIK